MNPKQCFDAILEAFTCSSFASRDVLYANREAREAACTLAKALLFAELAPTTAAEIERKSSGRMKL